MIKNIQKRASGFSMIELAVVIIIIGILTAAVLKGDKVIKNSKLSAARTATNSSAVHAIEGVILWLEATSQDSYIDTEGPAGDDGSAITKWVEINSQTTNKETLDATGVPTYDEDGINDRPAINFSAGGASFSSVNFPNIGNEATIFLVMKPSALNQQVMAKSPATINSSTNFVFGAQVPEKDLFWCFTTSCEVTSQDNISANTPFITSLVYEKDYTGTTDRVRTYVNSYTSNEDLESTTANGTNLNNLTIGKGPTYDFTGSIGEVIIFDQKLNSDDHRAVMKYLGKKWGINISE